MDGSRHVGQSRELTARHHHGKTWLPANVFLSHAREDAEEIELLRRLLRARGLRAWRDVTELPVGVETRGYIQGVVREDCDAFLLYLTRSCLDSHFIWSAEVPAALRQLATDPTFSFIPVFREVTPGELDEFCANNAFPSLAQFNGVVPPWKRRAPSQAAIGGFLADVARRTLERALPAHFTKVGAASDHRPRICFRTFPLASPGPYLDLDIDWTAYLADRVAAPEEWSGVLLAALRDVKDLLSGLRVSRRIHVVIQARLAAAVAFGYIFRCSTGFTIDVESRGIVYSTSGAPVEQETLVMRRIELSGDPRAAVVAVSISRDVSAIARAWIQNQSDSVGALIDLAPAGGPYREAVSSPGDARSMASQIGAALARLNSEDRVSDIHLFLSVPAPLAVLIGHQLNACGRIHLYQREGGEYTAACLLE